MTSESMINRALAESTAHGVSRLVGARQRYVKVTWLLLFLGFLSLFTKNAVVFVQKLLRDDVAKFLEPDSVEFLWPDLYLCPENPISGSYPLTLSKDEVLEMERHKRRSERRFHKRYEHRRRLEKCDSFYALNIIHSIPYRLLSDKLGHRAEQFAVSAFIKSDYRIVKLQIVKFHHPQFINCFKILLDPSAREQLRSDEFAMYLYINLDPYFSHFHPVEHPLSVIKSREVPNISYDVFEWSPVLGNSVEKTNGVNLIVSPPNTYPSIGNTNFMLAPGRGYQLKLEMDERDFSPELVGRKCHRDVKHIHYYNPYTGEADKFEYDGDYCFHFEVTRLLHQLYNCSLPKIPKPWPLRHVPSCYNLSHGQLTADPGFDHTYEEQNLRILTEAKKLCKSEHRCSSRHYSRSYSFGNWPSYGSAVRFVDVFLRRQYQHELKEHGYHLPAWKFLLDMTSELTKNESTHLEGLFRAYLSESMLKVVIRSESTMSPRILMVPAYTLTSLMADTGGLLGFYIGCSMLTLCELIELLHNICLEACKSRGKTRSATETTVMSKSLRTLRGSRCEEEQEDGADARINVDGF